MINATSVYERLCKITTLDTEGAAASLPLCSEAAKDLSGRLRDSAFESDERVIYAAAAIVYYNLMLQRCVNEGCVTEYKAGDVSVTQSMGYIIDCAQRIKDDALLNITALLTDDLFVFKQVGL